MRLDFLNGHRFLIAMVFAIVIGFVPVMGAICSGEIIHVAAVGFQVGVDRTDNGSNSIVLRLDGDREWLPFNQSAVKQDATPAGLGPDPKIPYFTVRFAMPIPPENATNNVGDLVGIDPAVFTHNHSPGFEILPNGDALAVYFSTPPGESENSTNTTFIQARLRYGSEEWDLPELFFDFKGLNDQSGLLWNDGGKIRFFGGGRDALMPFKTATSADNGATWTLSLPLLEKPPENFTAQPITSAFRIPGAATASRRPDMDVSTLPDRRDVAASGAIYFAMDGVKAESFLWRSLDDGIHWQQMDGRTSGRHSAIVPLDDKGDLLSIGGKNNAINGWSPENTSTNSGASWSEPVASPFPPLGTAQRPSLIKLADGNLFFVSDSYLHKIDRAAPAGWKYGDSCFVALSTNNGASWRIKPLPVQLPGNQRTNHPTLGYVTARQAPNGVIHILTTITQPCLHYELNEAWIFSEAGDVAPENSGGMVRKFSEKYSNGKIRSRWRARICPNGRYLLDGRETDYYESGVKEHEVTYVSGRKTGEETFWSPDGKKLWSWSHDLKNNRSVWTRYWPNGARHVQSTWNTKPTARDLNRAFFGMVADGPALLYDNDGSIAHKYIFENGNYAGEMPLKKKDTE